MKNVKNHVIIRNYDPSFWKHELVKTLICLISGWRHRSNHPEIYTEYPLGNDLVDAAVIIDGKNAKGRSTRELIVYEIQTQITKGWKLKIANRDLELGINTIIIPVLDLSDDLNELKEQLEMLVI